MIDWFFKCEEIPLSVSWWKVAICSLNAAVSVQAERVERGTPVRPTPCSPRTTGPRRGTSSRCSQRPSRWSTRSFKRWHSAPDLTDVPEGTEVPSEEETAMEAAAAADHSGVAPKGGKQGVN